MAACASARGEHSIKPACKYKGQRGTCPDNETEQKRGKLWVEETNGQERRSWRKQDSESGCGGRAARLAGRCKWSPAGVRFCSVFFINGMDDRLEVRLKNCG